MKKTLVIIGLLCLVAAVITISILLAKCRSNAGCPTGQSCRGKCPECPNSVCPAGQSCRDECPECKVCTGLNKVCSSTNKCVQCISDKDCPEGPGFPGSRPKLHCTPENTCKQCYGGAEGDKLCGDPSRPRCGKDGICYACINNADAEIREQCFTWKQFYGNNWAPPDIDEKFIEPVGTCGPGGQCALTGITVNRSYQSGKYMYIIDVVSDAYPEEKDPNFKYKITSALFPPSDMSPHGKELLKEMTDNKCVAAIVNGDSMKCLIDHNVKHESKIDFKNLVEGDTIFILPIST